MTGTVEVFLIGAALVCGGHHPSLLYPTSQGQREITRIHMAQTQSLVHIWNNLSWWKTIFSDSNLPRNCNNILLCAKNINQFKSPSSKSPVRSSACIYKQVTFVTLFFGASGNVKAGYGINCLFF
jgi:hypothetical protein